MNFKDTISLLKCLPTPLYLAVAALAVSLYVRGSKDSYHKHLVESARSNVESVSSGKIGYEEKQRFLYVDHLGNNSCLFLLGDKGCSLANARNQKLRFFLDKYEVVDASVELMGDNGNSRTNLDAILLSTDKKSFEFLKSELLKSNVDIVYAELIDPYYYSDKRIALNPLTRSLEIADRRLHFRH
ncbi:hypothetical protein H6503_03355 [Candidatus Woesearchaeota archaeon]|nr:hypothetical protein [Candidatus Woesearchaeota archaeon]